MRFKIIIVFLFVTVVGDAFCQSLQDKTTFLIEKWNLVENIKSMLTSPLNALKTDASDNDSVKIAYIENKITDETIYKRIDSALYVLYSEKQIDSIYYSILENKEFTIGMDGNRFSTLFNCFNDIYREIVYLTLEIEGPIGKPAKKILPMPVEREDGIYEAYFRYAKDQKDIIIAEKPSLVPSDYSDAFIIQNQNSPDFVSYPEIRIVLTPEGAVKYAKLTKEFTGKHIAIVVDKEIISCPYIQAEIVGGQFSLAEPDKEINMDERLAKIKKSMNAH